MEIQMASGTVLRAGGSTLLGTCKTYSSFFPLYIYVCFTSIHAPSVQLSKRLNRMYHLLLGWSILLATTAPKFCFLCSFFGRQHKTIRVLCIFLLKTEETSLWTQRKQYLIMFTCPRYANRMNSLQFNSNQLNSVQYILNIVGMKSQQRLPQSTYVVKSLQ